MRAVLSRCKILNVFLALVILFPSCATYRNMRPTGRYTVAQREELERGYAFRIVKMPSPEAPVFIIEFGRYPYYNEHRMMEFAAEKHDYSRIALGLGILAAGIGLAIASSDQHGSYVADKGDTVYKKNLYLTVAVVGGVIGGGLIWQGVKKQGETVYRSRPSVVEINDESAFAPVGNASLRASASSLGKTWLLSTDHRGRSSISMDEVAPNVRSGASLPLRFEFAGANSVAKEVTIPATFFKEYELYKSIVPSLILDLTGEIYSQEGIPIAEVTKNGTYNLIITPRNNSAKEATGISIYLTAPAGITLKKTSSHIDRIAASSPAETVLFPFSVARGYSDGSIVFEAVFRRGNYEIMKREIKVKVRQ